MKKEEEEKKTPTNNAGVECVLHRADHPIHNIITDIPRPTNGQPEVRSTCQ